MSSGAWSAKSRFRPAERELNPRSRKAYCGTAVADNQPEKNRVIDHLRNLCATIGDFISSPLLPVGGHPPDAIFNELALRVFEFQFTHNPAYQAFCRHQGQTPATVSHYREIPAIITSAFKELDLTVLPPAARSRVFYSSGTTREKRSRHFHNEDSLALYELSLARWFKPFVLPDHSTLDFLCLIPSAGEAPNSSLAHMMDSVSREFGGDVYQGQEIDSSRAITFVDEQGAWQARPEEVVSLAAVLDSAAAPIVICGTAFSFVHLCDYLASTRQVLNFPRGSRVFETGGYKGRSREVPKAELHALITHWLGIPDTHIISEYGMSELSSQAYDRVAGQDGSRVFRFPPWTRWDLVSPETGRSVGQGEQGLVRIWDLANVASVFAIQTEDLATREEDGFVLRGRAAAAEARGCSLMIG